MRVTIEDKRELVGTFMAFDKHMNLVLGDCEEHRYVKSRGSKKANKMEKQKRTLGLVLLRGENVISITVEGPPPSTGQKKRVAPVGHGVARMAGRGSMIMHQQQMQGAPRGLRGPIQGMGGPQPGMMQPLRTVAAQQRPQMMQPPRGMPPPPRGMMMSMPPRQMMPPRGTYGFSRRVCVCVCDFRSFSNAFLPLNDGIHRASSRLP